MFEPIHGSSPDIAYQNIANPLGQIWSGALMFEHLGEQVAADDIMKAMDATTEQGILPVDLGGTAKSDEIAQAIIELII